MHRPFFMCQLRYCDASNTRIAVEWEVLSFFGKKRPSCTVFVDQLSVRAGLRVDGHNGVLVLSAGAVSEAMVVGHHFSPKKDLPRVLVGEGRAG